MDSEREQVIQLLIADVVSTLGSAHRAAVSASVPIALEFTETVGDFAQKLVDDVQQELHDTHVDTTWPTCPRHSNHPLWFRDGGWWCEGDGVGIAPLGELSSRRSH